MSRAKLLTSSGYRVLNSAMDLKQSNCATGEPVDAVVLELDRNRAEIALIAGRLNNSVQRSNDCVDGSGGAVRRRE